MPLPVQKNKKNIQLTLPVIFYPLGHVKAALKEFKVGSQKMKTSKKSIRINFGIKNLRNALEFANYILSLNR
jgi:hypothetical protein